MSLFCNLNRLIAAAMETINNYLKKIATLLAFMTLFQNCVVYKNTPITLEQAVHKESKVMVETRSEGNFKFNRIGVENGVYYGVKKTKGEIVNRNLNKDIIVSIKEKDETLSTMGTIVVGSILGAVILIGIALATY